MLDNKSWVLFDMDNTLIDTGPLYLRARDKMANVIHAELSNVNVTLDDILDFQDKKDAQLFLKYGYSADRFAESFILTAIHFGVTHLADSVKQIALDVFKQISPPFPTSQNAIENLLGDFNLAIVTAGDYEVQHSRIRKLPFRNLFNDIWIVDDKTPEVFRSFRRKHALSDDVNHYMIGDSMRSDIIPSLLGGFVPLLIESPNNWKLVEIDGQKLPGNHKLQRFSNALEATKYIKVNR